MRYLYVAPDLEKKAKILAGQDSFNTRGDDPDIFISGMEIVVSALVPPGGWFIVESKLTLGLPLDLHNLQEAFSKEGE